jgi:hypothetical protein
MVTYKRSVMTKLIDDLELVVLKSPSKSVNVSVSSDDLLILIEYARQCESILMSLDSDPKMAKEYYKDY